MKSCPFCESTDIGFVLDEAVRYKDKAIIGAGAYAQCQKCWAKGPVTQSVEKAEAAWNERALIWQPQPGETVYSGGAGGIPPVKNVVVGLVSSIGSGVYEVLPEAQSQPLWIMAQYLRPSP